MATVLSLTRVGIGDVDLFMPSPPCLVVNTFYVDGEAESSVTYVWRDEETGELRSELIYMQPAGFEAALAWAKEHAPTRNVERIHTRHAPKAEPKPEPKHRPARKTAAKRRPVRKAAQKRRTAAKAAQKRRTPAKAARKPARKAAAKRRSPARKRSR